MQEADAQVYRIADGSWFITLSYHCACRWCQQPVRRLAELRTRGWSCDASSEFELKSEIKHTRRHHDTTTPNNRLNSIDKQWTRYRQLSIASRVSQCPAQTDLRRRRRSRPEEPPPRAQAQTDHPAQVLEAQSPPYSIPQQVLNGICSVTSLSLSLSRSLQRLN
jgi:hypothetical protein